MPTQTPHLPPLAQAFFDQITKKHHPKPQIVRKTDSFLMKTIGFFLKPFNPEFMSSYITTIGYTIYLPDDFMADDELQALSVIAHETQHIIDYVANPVWFVLSYLFPQCLVVLSLLAFLGFVNPWMLLSLLFLGFLAPIPSPGRYKAELNGYRVSLLLGRKVFHYTDFEMDQIHAWIKRQMTIGSYYFAWPFPNQIEKDLKDEGFEVEPRYQELTTFLDQHYRQSSKSIS